jgi:hypothetical protein
MSVRPDRQRLGMYPAGISILSFIAGLSFMTALHDWEKGDTSYWVAVVLVPACMGMVFFMSRKLEKALSL